MLNFNQNNMSDIWKNVEGLQVAEKNGLIILGKETCLHWKTSEIKE